MTERIWGSPAARRDYTHDPEVLAAQANPALYRDYTPVRRKRIWGMIKFGLILGFAILLLLSALTFALLANYPLWNDRTY